MQDTPFRSSDVIELRIHVNPVITREIDLDVRKVLNEGPTEA